MSNIAVFELWVYLVVRAHHEMPLMRRFHHHAEPADTNSNYAAVFSVWDRLFGARSGTEWFRGMKIGLKGVAHKSAIGLMLGPFQAGEG